MSHRFANPRGSSTGACPVEDSDSSYMDPPLTLSQRLQASRSDLNKRNAEVIGKFIRDYIEPLLKVQAISGLSKTMYWFVPPDTEQAKLAKSMAQSQNMVEGFGGSEKAGPWISKCTTKEYVKVIRLIGHEYSLEFWQQPAIVKELKQTLELRLRANGEKLADTTPNAAGISWAERCFVQGETLSPGNTGVELQFGKSAKSGTRLRCEVIALYAEIT